MPTDTDRLMETPQGPVYTESIGTPRGTPKGVAEKHGGAVDAAPYAAGAGLSSSPKRPYM